MITHHPFIKNIFLRANYEPSTVEGTGGVGVKATEQNAPPPETHLPELSHHRHLMSTPHMVSVSQFATHVDAH